MIGKGGKKMKIELNEGFSEVTNDEMLNVEGGSIRSARTSLVSRNERTARVVTVVDNDAIVSRGNERGARVVSVRVVGTSGGRRRY